MQLLGINMMSKKMKAMLFITVLFVLLLAGCTQMYICAKMDRQAGLNGSFEVTDGGYSVNWLYNAPPIKDGSATVSLDTSVFIDGKKSIKIVARKVSDSDRVWKKPGLSTRIPVSQRKTYRLSFRAKNKGSSFYAKWISATYNQKKHLRSKYVLKTDKSFSRWKAFADTISVDDNEKLILLDFVMTAPGTLWIDKVMFEELQ